MVVSVGRSSYDFSVALDGEDAVRVIASIEANVLANRATEDLKRGTRIGLREIESLVQWVPLHDMDAIQSTSAMIGMQLDSRITAGELLKPHHFEPIVRRNDAIKVHSGGSGFTLELDCISLEDGRFGETIEVRTDTPGRSTRNAKSIRVVVVDAGRAELLN
jgi:flagella basal body P-ring formation protein FlgA